MHIYISPTVTFALFVPMPTLQALLTERQPQPEKTKAARARPMSGKGVVMLCAASFFVGLLLNGRVTLLTPPSDRGSRLPLFSDGCDQSRRVSN